MSQSISSISKIAYYHVLRFHYKKVFYLLLLFSIVFSFAILMLTAFDLGLQKIVITDAAISLFGFFNFLFAIYLGMNAFQEEIENKNVYAFLTRASHFEYLSGGVLASIAYLFLSLLFLYTELFLILLHWTGKPPIYLAQNFLSHFSEGVLWLNLAVLFSLAVSQNLNFLLCFLTFIFSRIPLPVLARLPLKPLALFCYLFKRALPQLAIFNLKDTALQESWTTPLMLLAIFSYGILYGGFFFSCSWLIFKRKNL